jgi:hypothetical protein
MGLGDPQDDLLRAASPEASTMAPGGNRMETPVGPPKPEEVKLAPESWDDDLALRIVIADYEKAQQHRSNNFDLKWDDNDRLLHANVTQKTWDGTNTPRSSLGVKLVWQQVESLIPAEMTALFQNTDGIFFDTFPRPGTDISQAVACRELLAAQLDDADFWCEAEEILRSKNVHGTGILKLSWLRQDRERQFWSDELVPVLQQKLGVPFSIGVKRQFKRRSKMEQVNRPQVTYVSLRDFYIDPSWKRPRVQGAQFAIQRAMLSMDELLWMGENDPSYKIPSREDLIVLVKTGMTPMSAAADMSKQRSAQEADVREKYPLNPSADPAKASFEILEYWTSDRMVTVMNRKMVLRNIPNPYLFIPFLSVNYADVIDQFYGKGVAEIIGDEQRLQQGLINSHIDEVSLNIHGCMIVESGSVLNKGQLRRRPGQVIEAARVDSAKYLETKPVTQDWQAALGQSQIRSQQYTGVTDLATQGIPSTPTSATRTAHGVSTLSNAAFSRIEHIVKRDEYRLIVPMLDKLTELNQRFLDPRTEIQILGKTVPGLIALNPLLITNGNFRFELRASSRMSAKRDQQQALPFLLQTILNPALQQSLTLQKIKPNIQAITRDTLDILGFRNRNDWFVPMSQEEVQMANQPHSIPIITEMMKGQREKQRSDDKAQMMEHSQIADVVKIVISELMKGAVKGDAMPSLALGRALDDIGAHDAFENDSQPPGAQQ